jgi:hypothetical protein
MMQSALARQQGARPPLSGAGLGLMIAIWVVWLGVTLVADFLAFLMFAFADSPGSAGAAQAMVVPTFAWFAFTFVAGAVLLFLRRWWGIAIAFVLAISPPFMVFAGYNLLDSSSSGSGVRSSAGPPSTMPAPPVQLPPGGFVPAPMKVREQPDFQKTIAKYRDAAAVATRPAAATTQP